jgi:neutral trehalase
MKSVNQVLENTPIIFESNYIYPNPLNTTSINFKNFDLLTSHHDIHEFNENSINEITEKYTRRYKNLINTIKEQNKITFIRYCKNQQNIEEEEILRFYKNINKINPNLLFNFILISDYDKLIIPNNLLHDNFIYINLNNYIDHDVLNEENEYFKIIKKYKCIFDIVK